jgi:hypothetical protein
MTREDIVQMSAKSGIALYGMGKDREKFINYLEEFAKLVAQNEREACAKVCDGFYLSWIDIQGRYEFMGEGASEYAGAIRARGQE